MIWTEVTPGALGTATALTEAAPLEVLCMMIVAAVNTGASGGSKTFPKFIPKAFPKAAPKLATSTALPATVTSTATAEVPPAATRENIAASPLRPRPSAWGTGTITGADSRPSRLSQKCLPMAATAAPPPCGPSPRPMTSCISVKKTKCLGKRSPRGRASR